jgi:hypothetical protein
MYKNKELYTREKFSNGVRRKGVGTIPIVIETEDPELALVVNIKKEIEIHMDAVVLDLYVEIRRRNYNGQIYITLENGRILNDNEVLGELYKKNREDDKILYLRIVKECRWIDKLYRFFYTLEDFKLGFSPL